MSWNFWWKISASLVNKKLVNNNGYYISLPKFLSDISATFTLWQNEPSPLSPKIEGVAANCLLNHAHGNWIPFPRHSISQICVFGTIANILNIIVLTRKEMCKNPINRILKWLSVTDMFVMMEYIPFAFYMYSILPGKFRKALLKFVLVWKLLFDFVHTILFWIRQKIRKFKANILHQIYKFFF